MLKNLFSFIIFIIIISLFLFVDSKLLVKETETLKTEFLPVYCLFSLVRVFIALIISIIIGFVIGYAAYTVKGLSKIILTIIDILQSIPIFGYVPVIIFYIIKPFGESIIGIEISIIFLLVTCLLWNIIFSVYETMNKMPREIIEMCDAFKIDTISMIKKIYIPAATPGLVYNSMLSVSNGFFFLIICEIILFRENTYKMPGIGSFIKENTLLWNLPNLLTGVFSFIFLVLMINFLMWIPLSKWAQRFKIEYSITSDRTSSQQTFLSTVTFWEKGVFKTFGPSLFRYFLTLCEFFIGILIKFVSIFSVLKAKKYRNILKAIFFGTIYGVSLLAVFTILVLAIKNDGYKEVINVISMTGVSAIRLLIAYVIALLLIFPIALYTGRSEKRRTIIIPLTQIFSCFPYSIFFPFIVSGCMLIFGWFEVPAIVLITLGMMWYLLYNLLSAVSNIPSDFFQLAQTYRLSGIVYLRRIIFPCILPSLITGSMTAMGQGWNSLIIAEYIKYSHMEYSVYGIGAYLNKCITSGNTLLILLSVLAMISVILLLFKLIWEKLFALVSQKYRLEY